MPGVFVTSAALCWHDTGLQSGIRGGKSLERLQLDLSCCRWHQSVRALQSRCWTSAQPSMRFRPCYRPSEFRPNHISPFHPSRSYRGHHDANFNVAILDGHKEIVAHEKFQQLLHKKWGQRDKIHYGDDIRSTSSPSLSDIQKLPKSVLFPTIFDPMPCNVWLFRYNIFWSEMSKVQKLGHVIKQASRRCSN